MGGKHHPEGLFLAWGTDVRAGRRSEASLYDIAPTVLHYLGVPIPDDCDGHVRLEWFEPDSPSARREISKQAVAGVEFTPFEWHSEEVEQIESRLRDLGYLD